MKESDKTKKGELLSALLQALLPVWESLVLLKGNVEGGMREMRQTGETGKLTRMPPPQEMSSSASLLLVSHGMINRS